MTNQTQDALKSEIRDRLMSGECWIPVPLGMPIQDMGDLVLQVQGEMAQVEINAVIVGLA